MTLVHGSAVPTEIEAAFVAGFRLSGEGYNGEWPFEGVSDDCASFEPVLKAAREYAAKATTPTEQGERG